MGKPFAPTDGINAVVTEFLLHGRVCSVPIVNAQSSSNPTSPGARFTASRRIVS